jgi:DNA-binding response OmpR family regulator
MKHILIIDDDPGIQEILKIIFEKAGYTVSIECNGRAILNNQYQLPDIFLLDRYLSGIDGIDICRHLKADANTRHIPVIMISASPDIAVQSILAGADCYIEKPFNIKDLLSLTERTVLHVE